MEKVVDLAGIERKANVLRAKFKPRFVCQVSEVLGAPCQQVIGAYDGVPVGQKGVAQMGAQKACSTRNQDTHTALPVRSSRPRERVTRAQLPTCRFRVRSTARLGPGDSSYFAHPALGKQTLGVYSSVCSKDGTA